MITADAENANILDSSDIAFFSLLQLGEGSGMRA
jgi:hypothetical protein